MKNWQKIGTKPPKRSWVLFEIEKWARNCKKTSLNILVLPPKTSWVFFDIEKHAKNVKKKIIKFFGSSLQN
jgi:hypothetical protein